MSHDKQKMTQWPMLILLASLTTACAGTSYPVPQTATADMETSAPVISTDSTIGADPIDSTDSTISADPIDSTGSINMTDPANSIDSDRSTGQVESLGQIALGIARSMIGTAYRYGGSAPSGFDCSGLVRYAFSQAGINLPRSSREIFRTSQVISEADLQPGDLVFFAIRKNRISHVGIYEANGLFIHAPSSGKGVGYASIDDQYWRQRLVGAGRL